MSTSKYNTVQDVLKAVHRHKISLTLAETILIRLQLTHLSKEVKK